VRKLWKGAIAAVAALAIGPVLAAVPAGATPPTGYGFDNTPHIVVAGGSDTTFKVIQDIGKVYSDSQLTGCPQVTAVGATLGQCVANASAETSNLGNYQHDTMASAGPVGSTAGVASLNGISASSYAGALNPVPAGSCLTANASPNADYARSSRGPRTTGGSAPCGNELTADTFWGFAQDGIEVLTFNNRGAQIQGVGGSAITASELHDIYECVFTQWSQVPSLGIAPGSPTDGPIVPFGMNTSSGTYATFRDFIRTATGDATFDPSGNPCNAKILDGPVPPPQTGIFPLENDAKQIISDPTIALSSNPLSVDNPENWIWWGSFGVFSAFPYTSTVPRGGTTYQALAVPIGGVLPSTSGIIANTYPIGRTLYHVTRKGAADCPVVAGPPVDCAFTSGGLHTGPAYAAHFTGTSTPPAPAGNDLNVVGPVGGTAGAVREFTRFLCRGIVNQHGAHPFTGNNNFTEITAAINGSGFTVVPASLRETGSRCQVLTS
jgi:hypothetical protein